MNDKLDQTKTISKLLDLEKKPFLRRKTTGETKDQSQSARKLDSARKSNNARRESFQKEIELSKGPEMGSRAEKMEVQALAKLKEQIEFMKNRLKYIEISKDKNKGKIDNMKKKTDHILSIRNFAEEDNKIKTEKTIIQENQQIELKQKVEEYKQEIYQNLQNKKEQMVKEKSDLTNKNKEEKKENRELKKLKESQELSFNKELIKGIQAKNSCVDLRLNSSSGARCLGTKKGGLFAGKEAKLMAEEFEQYGVSEMKQQLEELIRQENMKKHELHRIVDLEKDAAREFVSVTQSKLF